MQNTKKNKDKITLQEYMKLNGLKKCFFAQQIGIQPNSLSRILSGYAPTLKMAIDIEKYTKGKISVYDWDLSKVAHCVKPETYDDNKKENCDA